MSCGISFARERNGMRRVEGGGWKLRAVIQGSLICGVLSILVMVAGCMVPPVWGLRPIYPETSWPQEQQQVFTRVPSRSFEFEWEAFPRAGDLQAIQKSTGKSTSTISDVTYELRVWEADTKFPETFRPWDNVAEPGPLVYTREGLLMPRHKMSAPLKWRTNYFWSVRARFLLDGHPRVTSWGVLGTPSDEAVSYYRFRTP